MELISAPIDFLGVNYYSPHYVKIAADERPAGRQAVEGRTRRVPTTSRPSSPRNVDGLADRARRPLRHARRGRRRDAGRCRCTSPRTAAPPRTTSTRDGEVDDFERVDYLHGHLEAACAAIQDGVPLAGYFHLVAARQLRVGVGLPARFGLVFVDFETQRRIPKRSAGFYAQVADTNALPGAGGPDGEATRQPRQA